MPAASARQTPTTLIDCGSAVEGSKDEPTTESYANFPVSIDHGGYCERRVWGMRTRSSAKAERPL
jgi:hypothetical protein